MHDKFISVVILLKSEYLENVNPFLIKVHKILKNNFSHFIIIYKRISKNTGSKVLFNIP
mgnify:CR=1 FL=1